MVSILRPVTLRAEASGKASILLREGAAFTEGAPVARVMRSNGEVVELRAPKAGHIERLIAPEGTRVEPGDEVVALSPTIEEAWEALRGLYFAGLPEDIPEIQRYTQEIPGMPDRVRKQAALTTEAIRTRAAGETVK
jgi:pyruvate/2-oxoglutarate dehydrogenase complex dihydrolipoamide acyltransferase (E2) component